ncbi:hypothetical protein J2I47_20620 [Fibrella sp. HMF5335]|uniref:DUF3108 domain-containing protein n=1 Tax=Fibrella rubiginis TaxID=2817060 RepID=A0A939GKK0_9BACT|nr:hypothetical protein [Fibrella rubiginis]MBO0938969.1 hypothetical protein [Fibrella rubiginis]
MKHVFLLLLIWSLSLTAAWGSNDVWNNGYVTLPDGQRIEGQLNYNWKAEVLRVKISDGTAKAYSASRVRSFAYFDDEQNLLRRFSAIAFAGPDDTRRFVFMEECTVGKLSVYRRLHHAHEFIKMGRPSLFGSDREMIKDYDNFDYIVLDDTQVTDLQHFSTDLWPQMQSEFSGPLGDYVKTRQLDITSTVAKLMLINQYNYLKIKADENAVATEEETPESGSVEPAAGINSAQE